MQNSVNIEKQNSPQLSGIASNTCCSTRFNQKSPNHHIYIHLFISKEKNKNKNKTWNDRDRD